MRKLRAVKGLDQGEVAKRAGITQPGYSRIEREERPIAREVANKLCRALALGEQGEAEDDPHYVLAADSLDRGFDLIFVGTRRAPNLTHLGLFRERRAAERVARILNGTGGLPIHAIPVWLDFAGASLARRLGRAPDGDELFVVDSSDHPALRADASFTHGLAVRKAFAAESDYGVAAADLAASVAGRKGTSK